MNLLGKLKTRPPPTPHTLSQNTEFNNGHGWPADEFDNESVYEPPPCEPPPIQSTHVKENIYMDNISAPTPPPWPARPSKSTNSSEMKEIAPEINRREKPRGMKATSTPAVPVATAQPNTIADEGVYMDPDKQVDDEDVYLEPVGPSPVREGIKVMPHDYLLQSSSPWMKPPVPRQNSCLASLNAATPVNFNVRRTTLPLVLPPHPHFQATKPLSFSSMKRNKETCKSEALSDCSAQTKLPDNEVKEWFAGNCSRKQAEDHLLGVNMDGAFLIRRSSGKCSHQPFTLAVLFQQKVFNIPIRLLEETHCYILGKEGKKIEEKFSNLQELILHHQKTHLHLIDSKTQAKHTTFLTQPTRP